MLPAPSASPNLPPLRLVNHGHAFRHLARAQGTSVHVGGPCGTYRRGKAGNRSAQMDAGTYRVFQCSNANPGARWASKGAPSGQVALCGTNATMDNPSPHPPRSSCCVESFILDLLSEGESRHQVFEEHRGLRLLLAADPLTSELQASSCEHRSKGELHAGSYSGHCPPACPAGHRSSDRPPGPTGEQNSRRTPPCASTVPIWTKRGGCWMS